MTDWTLDTRWDVQLTGFTPGTHDVLTGILRARWGREPGPATRPVPIEYAADLYFLLRAMPDSAFPGGKWATVQHLGQLLDTAYTTKADNQENP